MQTNQKSIFLLSANLIIFLTWRDLSLWYHSYYIASQIIRNCYRHIDFSCQSRFETNIAFHTFILLKHYDKILNLVLYLVNEPLTLLSNLSATTWAGIECTSSTVIAYFVIAEISSSIRLICLFAMVFFFIFNFKIPHGHGSVSLTCSARNL